MRFQRVFNIIATVILFGVSIYLGVSLFSTSYLRFWEALCDLWESMKYYAFEMFEVEHEIVPGVEGYSDVLKWDIFLPSDYSAFRERLQAFWRLLLDGENFQEYIQMVGEGAQIFTKVFVIALPLLMVLLALVKKLYSLPNHDHNKDTGPLRAFKWVSKYTYTPVRRVLGRYCQFMRDYMVLPVLLIVMWVFHLNVASIITAFFAYYFFLVISFKVDTIFIQFFKLFVDLQVVFRTVPWWVLLVVGWLIFNHMRKRIAGMRLHYMEARNCGFIKELPIVSLTCGSMGKKKTTVITDMALSQEVMFRQQAFELLKKNDMRFPRFPWISFEMQIRRCMEYGTIYNLASIKKWVNLKRQRFMHHHDCERQLYGYRADLYGLVYDDGVIHRDIFDVLESYAQLYFIYVIESSLLVANYSIRTDHELMDSGNFPMWYADFFPETTSDSGRHAHILDFDVLRLGRKVIEDNPNNGSFEFGIVVISEVGKERGNVLDQREMRRDNQETNQKNDLFNGWLKMCRHSATVEYFPFIKVFADEQRPESWGADARDLCDIITIVSADEDRLAYPFYTLEEMVYEILTERFMRLYYRFRHNRGDNTLLVYLLKTVVSWLYHRNVRIHNRYGYCIARLEKRRGTMDGKIKRQKYYLMNKKIYARRFSTDCFSDYFNDMALRSEVSLQDYPEYETERASVEELRYQNSYFITSRYRDTGSE